MTVSIPEDHREFQRQALAAFKRGRSPGIPPQPRPAPTFQRSERIALTCVHNLGKPRLTEAGCGGCGGARFYICALHHRVEVERCRNCDDFISTQGGTDG